MISSNRSSRILLNKRRFDNSKYKFFLRLPDENEMKVRFESRFENGNLKKAIKVSDTEYNLLLNFDYNTRGHTQWFYFKVMTKLPAGTTLQFRILNLMKPDSLYNCGMKP
jgi:cytosolic carboxypeptidase protein 2/3